MPSPTVSIVVAAYNRSNVLELAIASAVAQTLTDWQMLVVGDACTDDSEQVVASFADERIAWTNLPVNHGDQSIPNNHGVERSTGRYVAFLNQDDLWFPDHLERCVACLERSEAGGLFSPVGVIGPGGTMSITPSWTGEYIPTRVNAPASGWLLRRATIERVGSWRSRHECIEAPSRDWLMRAVRQGEAIEQLPRLTVLAFPSAARPGSYAQRDDLDQRRAWQRMRSDPSYREDVLTEVALAASAELVRPRPLGHARQAAKDAVVASLRNRWMPTKTAVRYRRKGGLVDELRRIRGLPPHEHPS
jgi:glycosyltransferase involved in cell wall biosynthesis